MKPIKSTALIVLALTVAHNGAAQAPLRDLSRPSPGAFGYSPESGLVPGGFRLSGWSFAPMTGALAVPRLRYDDPGAGFDALSDVDADSSCRSRLQQMHLADCLRHRRPPSNSSTITERVFVPFGAASLLLDVYGSGVSFTVTLGGQPIEMMPLETFPTYTLYGGILPAALKGRRETLVITDPPSPGLPPGTASFGGIQFSPTLIPEPSALALSGLGALFLAWRARKRQQV